MNRLSALLVNIAFVTLLVGCGGGSNSEPAVDVKVTKVQFNEALAQISDANFAACLAAQSATYADQVTNIDCDSMSITSIDGIAVFTSLEILSLRDNQLTNVDVSNNIALTFLYLDNNQLTNVDVSSNTSLTYLSLENTQLTNVDVSSNTALIILDLDNNQITN